MAAAENRPATPGWIVVTRRNSLPLWRGGKIPALFVPFSIVLSFMSYLLATNKELSLTPPKEMVFFILQITRGRSSYQPHHRRQCDHGERENGTFGKFVGNAGKPQADHPGQVSGGLIALAFHSAISTVYIALLAPSAQIFWLALLLVSVLGSILMIIFAGRVG